MHAHSPPPRPRLQFLLAARVFPYGIGSKLPPPPARPMQIPLMGHVIQVALERGYRVGVCVCGGGRLTSINLKNGVCVYVYTCVCMVGVRALVCSPAKWAPPGRCRHLCTGTVLLECCELPAMTAVARVDHGREQVLIHESRGIGRSSCNAVGRQTTTLLAADAHAVLDGAWGTDSAFALFGVSLGGLVAQELLYRLVAAGQKWVGAVWNKTYQDIRRV